MNMGLVHLASCAIAAILATSMVGCDDGGDGEGGAGGNVGTGGTGGTGGAAAANQAIATIEGKSGSMTNGSAVFTEQDGAVMLQIVVSGAPPGEHAVHIHEHPDCTADDAMSAGDHWNPTMEDHGKWGTPPFHLGDIGNITVGDDGTGNLSLSTDLWTLGTGETNDIVDHAIMVHADPDDFVSQPSGNAGARIGCGVIERK